MKKINTRKALNPAYRKHKPLRKEVTTFIEKLNLCIEAVKLSDEKGESEEHIKSHFKDFFTNTFYKENYINTKERIDLAIYLDNTAKSDIGVIIEAKKPSNKAEFISENNLNKKALQELLLYYLRERLDGKNNNIKHLIATNGYEWFLFKAEDFYNYFYKNKALIKEYEAFRDGLKDTTKNELFYSEIAKKYIEEVKEELPFVHLDFSTVNLNSLDDNKLNTYFKIFSNVHLLGHSFGNDSNQLNKNFYHELLHIIGLEEVTDSGKKVIQRKGDKTRDYASLLENTIFTLEDKDYLRKVNSIESQENKAFNVGLELCLTWINRILFLKLLESQLATYHKGAKEYKFLNSSFINGFDALNDLFFSALAKPYNERHDKFSETYKYIPYLNSSLFSVEDGSIEDLTFRISALKDDEMTVHPSTVLKDSNGKKLKGKLTTLDYLFKFLDAYDFATDGTEGIIDGQETKTLINASVLGLIFEKINGYKDGSFYTPGYITMYMCKETIRTAVTQKFKEQENKTIENFDEVKAYSSKFFKPEDTKRLNTLINSLRICDPAVGSGHFLVSALNELIVIKNELGILVDEKGVSLRVDIQIENDELYISDANGNLFEYNPNDAESTRIQKTLFEEKQTLIENCLFGVDINPNSVKICRLRLWIELLKNAYYTEKKQLHTLPNIDINIKCGNSLISRFDLQDDLKDAFKGKEVKYNFTNYKKAVNDYKNSNSKEEKYQVLEIINEVKNNLKSVFYTTLKENKELSNYRGQLINLQTANVDLFGTKLSKSKVEIEERRLKQLISLQEEKVKEIASNAIYKNAFEWRFEFPEVLDDNGKYIGFDVVIGNPPYIYNRDLPKIDRDFYQLKYLVADDLYHYFTNEAISIAKTYGVISYITPNTYFTLSTKEKYRETLLKYDKLKITYSGFVFEDAYVEAQIFSLIKNNTNELSDVIFVKNPNDYIIYEELKGNYNLFKNNFLKRFFWPNELNINIHNKINLKFEYDNFKNVLLGKKTNISELITNYRSTLTSNKLTLLGLISEGEQGLVTGNNSKYIGKIVKNDEEIYQIDIEFLKILNKYQKNNISLIEFQKNKEYYYELAENLKLKEKKPSLFGKFFNYKSVEINQIKSYKELSDSDKTFGGQNDLWLYYNRGNSEGHKWHIPYTECIKWNKKSVKELREGKLTNSRWQGETFYNACGFGWVDYFTDKIKAFYIEEGVYSKNIVKFHNVINISDMYIVALLNSKFISYYIKNFVTATHTLQINDGRLIPIIIPDKSVEKLIIEKVDLIINSKRNNSNFDSTDVEREIDSLVYKLYGLTKEEIEIVENS